MAWNLTVSSRFLGSGSEEGGASLTSSVCTRFSLFVGGTSSLGDDAVDAGEGMRGLLLFCAARFAAAARAALETGTWMPSDGSDNDLRRVLYGMITERRATDSQSCSVFVLLSYALRWVFLFGALATRGPLDFLPVGPAAGKLCKSSARLSSR